MENTLKLVGRNSNEIFLLRYPSSLLDFCGFDLSYFAKTAIDACSEAQKTGKADPDVFAQLRRDIQNAHCFIAHNIRTTYEKVALDCWIDYLCRRDSIGTGTLWNRYITCRTPFDKMVFSRLCEFRYNRAINEWLNIVRVQDYAKSKIDFVFTKDVKNAREAASRRNYFDLMFSVTAQEMGCRVEKLGEIKVFSVGRTPSSPFMFSTISKDIVRHVLADFDYTDDYSDIGDYSEISDQIAMDAFSKMKAGLPAELSSYNIVRGKMENYTDKIYMPCSLKAVVDLEIDAIIESGGILCACKRCGRLYLKNEEYNEDYCRTYLTNGKTCLELYREENPLPVISPELEEKCRTVTDEIYARVGTSMSTKEYEYWHSYMSAMRDKVMSGEITAGEFDAFLDYSLKVDISRSRPIVEVPKHEERPSRERVVKPFVPERISRSELSPNPEPKKSEPEEEPPKDGFFTSPTVFKRKNEGQQISHIIRGGEPRSAENGGRTGFQPFSDAEDFAGKKAAEDRARLERRLEEELRRKLNAAEDLSDEVPEDAPRGEFVPFSGGYSGEERGKTAGKSRFDVDDNTRNENYLGEERGKTAGKSRFVVDDNARSENYFGEERGKTAGKSRFVADDNTRSENYLGEERGKSAGKSRFELNDNSRNENYFGEERGKSAGKSRFVADDNTRSENYFGEEYAEKTAPKPKVIKKNAAAISAYGKISGAPVTTAPPDMDLFPPKTAAAEKTEAEPVSHAHVPQKSEQPRYSQDYPEDEPFKDIGSIFDVLEQSEGNMGAKPRRMAQRTDEPPTEREIQPREEEPPREVTKENAPSGIWTEDRHLYGSDTQSELDMLKEKKHSKSNKTRRLYDVIMREPDDNPNFRRKN